MSGDVFVDTNVLIYARDASRPDKQQRAFAWVTKLFADERGRVSGQVLHEYYQNVTRKLKPAMPVADARADVRALLTWRPVPMDASVLQRAWEVEDRYQLSWWDALIVAAAQASGSPWLLTDDLQAGQNLGGVVVVNPFLTAPEALS